MMEQYKDIFQKLEDLTDLEVAVFLCLVGNEHCLVDTELHAQNDVANELALICEDTFGLSYAVIDCSTDMSLDKFNNAILDSDTEQPYSPLSPNEGYTNADILPFIVDETSSARNKTSRTCSRFDNRKVVNVIIAKNFDHVSQNVQIQALELICSKRVYTRTALHIAPNFFIFIPLLVSDGRALVTRLNKHLNQHIFMSHYHDPTTGFANLEAKGDWASDDQVSLSSVIHNSPSKPHRPHKIYPPLYEHEEIQLFRQLSHEVTMSAEVNCYLQNMVVFLRLNRAVAGGISPIATRQFHKLAKCLASLHHVDYVPPSLVGLAARKVYRHRISISRPEDDRSVLYGSDIKALDVILSNITPEDVIDEMISHVEAPL